VPIPRRVPGTGPSEWSCRAGTATRSATP
jgi:hypothetical protein